MAEFRTLYYGPMDREYHQAISEAPKDYGPSLEEPILPINQLGETVPEHDPSGRFKNIIQTTQAAIRGGAGTLQLVMMTPPESAIGGRPKAYGKEVREALKEVALASKVNIAGVELPTALNNLAGFDYQNLVFSDEKRKQGLDEVKDAIKFAADVGRGGGVDIVSWEFPRGINEADWNKPKDGKLPFVQEGEQRIGWLVDDRTGRTMQIRKDEVQHIAYDKKNFEPIRLSKEQIEKFQRQEMEDLPLQKFEWDDFKRWADKSNEQIKKGIDPETGKTWGIDPETNQPWAEGKKQIREEREQARREFEQRIKEGRIITPDEKYIDVQLQGQINSLIGWRTTYAERARKAQAEIDAAEKKLREDQTLDDQDRERLKEFILSEKRERDDSQHTAFGQQQQIDELRERFRHIKPIKEYALGRSARTYAEAGIMAMRTTKEGMERQNPTINRDLHVGPEIGWPGYYGSHPDEFIELVQNSRKEMVKLLMNKKIKDLKGNEVDSPYYDRTMTKERAEEMAKRHVKGLFDTSHMGMWLAHFEALPGESEEKRIERFKKDFYLPAVDKIIKAGVVGGIQLVDSMSAAHGHLPPGEGIFPVIETAKKFKDSGFNGFMVSEGHEEERFGEGRIRSKLWQHAGANIGAGYFSGPPLRWGQVQQGYFGKTYSPLFMFGGYSPSNEFKLWSEVPLE
jgi:hypothetical protein